MRRRRGITLIELLTAMALSGIVLMGLVSTFAMAIQTQLADGQKREEFETNAAFEQRVRNLISHAYITTDAADLNTFFHGRTLNGASSLGANASDELTFTTVGTGVAGSAINNAETDFDARNQAVGPVGGVKEVSISMTPVGQASAEGVFLREQEPSDTDPDQGGEEQVMDSGIASVSFEFFDGTDWIGDWDTDTNRTLPLAVRVTYQRTDDEGTNRVFVVRLTNQVVNAAAQQGGANGGA